MPSVSRFRHLIAPIALTVSFTVSLSCSAQPTAATPAAPSGPVMCKPVAQRTSELGCYVVADHPVGPLTSSQVYWHLDTYPAQEAAGAATGPRSVVVNSLGQVWLFTIETADWQAPAGGRHVATIGPLPLPAADTYTASYMEAVFMPGMKSAIHDHPGPEAFYTLSGETCLETPVGKSINSVAGAPVIVAAGLPMQLTATGKDKRKGFALVLHDSSQPGGSMVHTWTPKNLCD